MKKRYGFAFLFLCIGVMLAGCGKKEEEQEDGQLGLHGSAVVGEYRGVTYTPYDTAVTEEEIQAQLDRFLDNHAQFREITDRDTVQNGDVANIDYIGYMDGEAFANGADTDYNLEIGSGGFIPGFEEGLIGAKKGSQTDVKLSFPDPYLNNPDFSGKEAVFSVTVNKISEKIIPELTDELVAANTEHATVQEYQDYLKESLRSQKEEYAQNVKASAVMQAVIASAEFTGVEQSDIDAYYTYTDTYNRSIASSYESMYGLSFLSFIRAFFGCATEEEYEQRLRQEAEQRIKWELVLYYVIEQEGLAVTDEEYQEEVEKYLKDYNLTEEQFEEQVSADRMREMILLQKAENLVLDSAVAAQ